MCDLALFGKFLAMGKYNGTSISIGHMSWDIVELDACLGSLEVVYNDYVYN